MRRKFIFLAIILNAPFLFPAFAQWPGNFYAFILKSATGSVITPANKEYKMITVPASLAGVVMEIKICKDDSVWRFYEGGNHYMGSTQQLKIVRIINGKISGSMIIEFPPSMSKGKEQYYRNLYAGVLRFKKGILKIKLPPTGEEWDNLNEMKLCEDGINFTSYYDVSNYQNQ